MTITSTASTPEGGFALTITGTSGALVHTVPATFVQAGASSPVVDRIVTADGNGTRTTQPFSTSVANETLIAFAASDGPGSGGQTMTITGAGLTWRLVTRVNAQAGTSEIWQATAQTLLSNVTVRSTPAIAGFDQSLTVVTFSGSDGAGVSAGSSAASGAPSVSLTTTGARSLVYAVGNDWDSATNRTTDAGQSIVHEWVDTIVGDTFWTQAVTAPIAAAGTVVRMSDVAPDADRWNFAAVEILAAESASASSSPVPNVVNLALAAARTRITDAGFVVSTVTYQSSTTVPADTVISQNPIGGTQAAPGSSVALVVSSGPPAPPPSPPPPPPPPPADITVDRVVSIDGRGTLTTPAFSTTAGGILIALVSADGPGYTTQTAAISGAGLTWTLVRRANVQPGTSEIWTATAPGALTNVTVTSALYQGGRDQSLTVVAFRGASAIGASVSGNSLSGAASLTVTTTRARALVYGVGNDWDNAASRTLNAGQLMVHQWVDSAIGDTFWTQATASAITNSGTTVQLGTTAPTQDRWNFVVAEIVP